MDLNDKKNYISIIVPCFNEEDNVQKLFDEFLPVVRKLIESYQGVSIISDPIELVFIDDGSEDNTYSRLENVFGKLGDPKIKVQIQRHKVNLGLGAALRTGFRAANGEIIVSVDSDGSYRYSEIIDILSLLRSGVDVITASPYHPRGNVDGVPPVRLFLSKGSSFIYRILLDKRLHTYTSLFRVYRSEVVNNISFDSNDYLAGTELLVKAMLCGYKVDEYPTVLYKRLYGVSKAKIFKTIVSHLRFQGRLLLHRFQIISLIECP